MTPAEPPPAEPVDIGEAAEAPTFALDPATNRVSITWPGTRPDEVIVSSDLLEQIVDQHNQMVQQIDNQRMVLQIVRLGRRPNLADWVSVGMAPGQGTRIDLTTRKQ